MSEGLQARKGWRLVALAAVAAIAPFNVKVTTDAWTSLDLRLLVILALVTLVVVVGSNLVDAGWRMDWIDAAVLLWLAAIWVSALSSDQLALGSAGAARLSVAILLIPAVRGTVRSRHDARQVLGALATGAVLGSLVGLGIWMWGADLDASRVFVGEVTALGPFNRLTRPWSHANVAAMAMGASLASIAIVRHRFVRTAALVVLTIALVLTISRGGLLALAAAGIAWAVLRRDKRDVAAVAGLALVAVITVALSAAWTTGLEVNPKGRVPTPLSV